MDFTFPNILFCFIIGLFVLLIFIFLKNFKEITTFTIKGIFLFFIHQVKEIIGLFLIPFGIILFLFQIKSNKNSYKNQLIAIDETFEKYIYIHSVTLESITNICNNFLKTYTEYEEFDGKFKGKFSFKEINNNVIVKVKCTDFKPLFSIISEFIEHEKVNDFFIVAINKENFKDSFYAYFNENEDLQKDTYLDSYYFGKNLKGQIFQINIEDYEVLNELKHHKLSRNLKNREMKLIFEECIS